MCRSLPGEAVVVGVDRGVDHARVAGREVDVVVGDLDSVSANALEWARGLGARIEVHPEDKNMTDLEVALDLVDAMSPRRVIVLAGAGTTRLDHQLANLALVASPALAHLRLEAFVGPARVVPVHNSRSIRTTVGEAVTLVALGGPVTGITTTGLSWPLNGDTLMPGSTRGVSNVAVAGTITVEVRSGSLLVIIPGTDE